MTPRRIVVAGGGLAGLAAAAAAARHCAEVVVVERTGGTDGRAHTWSHRAQLHNVLTRGQWELERIFPGYRAAFLTAGGQEGDVASDTHVHEFGGDSVNRPLGLSIWSAPWRTLWEVAYGLMPANVKFWYSATVAGLDVQRNRVRGIRCELPGGVEAIAADAVVDATGHGSYFTRLLGEVGAETPRVELQRLDRWFLATRLRRPPALLGRPDYWMTFGPPPERKVALISPCAEDEWLLSVSSQDPLTTPPGAYDSVLAYIDGLPGPPLRPILEGATPIADPSVFWRREVYWRHYEEITEPLRGFVAVGDALSSINPVFGQGVGVAAWQASLLGEALGTSGGADEWTRAYQRSAADVVAQAWALGDIPFETHKLIWDDLLLRLADDIDLHRRYVGLWHLVEVPSSLVSAAAPSATSAGARRNSQ
jgi:2-polyprenyl-6-methoxyphenol hydroxylase-like FAD-dependent oxidoreductase